MKSFVASCVGIVLFATAAGSASADWMRFRGPNGNAVSDDTNIPTEWTAKKNVKWKLKLPGKGFSSPIVVSNKVFVTCFTGTSGNNLTRYLLCVDRSTGKEVWKKAVPSKTREFRSAGRMGYHGYASSTPASDGERVYVMFGTTGILAYDLDGKQLWQKSIGSQQNAMFGSANSPIIYKNMVIVTASNESATFYAFDGKTGKQVWKIAAGTLSESYSTPIIAANKQGDDELLFLVPNEVWSMNPNSGKLNWYCSTPAGGNVCSSLVSKGDIIYAVGGGGRGQPGHAAIRIGGKDDITKSNRLWAKNGGAYVPSPVLYKGHLYWVNDRGSVTCVDAKTGRNAGSKRLNGAFYASPVIAGGKMYLVSRYSGTFVLDATPKLTEIARNNIGDESDFSGSPAVSDGQMFLRSDSYLFCIAKD